MEPMILARMQLSVQAVPIRRDGQLPFSTILVLMDQKLVCDNRYKGGYTDSISNHSSPLKLFMHIHKAPPLIT
jgi:hypothetical protein